MPFIFIPLTARYAVASAHVNDELRSRPMSLSFSRKDWKASSPWTYSVGKVPGVKQMPGATSEIERFLSPAGGSSERRRPVAPIFGSVYQYQTHSIGKTEPYRVSPQSNSAI
jgi:hypothetical protein